jgi:peptidoglycan/xylan/chitin deacetylase (PgdA/CDA1 family)
MYHGVTDHPVPNWTQVLTREFEEQMRYLQSAYIPVSLQQAEEMLSGRQALIDHAVVVTFDDGFRNNITNAYPILRRYNIPATIFVTTSFLDRDERFNGFIWTDYVYALLEGATVQELDLRDLGLSRYDLSTCEFRYRAKGALCNRLKQIDFEEKNRIIERIGQRLNSSVSSELGEAFGPMTWEDLRMVSDEQLVSFGAHTVNHEILSRLPEDVMREEIVGSQTRLETFLGRPVRHFAYPNGTPEDFTEGAAKLVSERFSCALTTIHGLNDRSTDRYMLKRIPVGRGTDILSFKLSLAGM